MLAGPNLEQTSPRRSGLARTEIVTSRWSRLELGIDAGLLERGWFPSTLKGSVENVVEGHDLGDGRGYGVFSFGVTDGLTQSAPLEDLKNSLEASRQIIQDSRLDTLESATDWAAWCESRVGIPNVAVAVDLRTGFGFFWTTNLACK